MNTVLARELLCRKVASSLAAVRRSSVPSLACSVDTLASSFGGSLACRPSEGGRRQRGTARLRASSVLLPVAAVAAFAAAPPAESSASRQETAGALLQKGAVDAAPAVHLAKTITDAYKFDDADRVVVGTGNRSQVFTARHISTGQLVAVKQMSRRRSSQGQWEEEVRMMRAAQGHRNCIRLLDSMEDEAGDSFYIVMELAQGGELFRRLQSHGRFTEGEAARIMAEILQAVEHLHSQGVVHFDIKPENIILRHGDSMIPEVMLADFGSAFSKNHVTGSRDYTAAYSAPEVLLRSCAIDEKADIWSMGVLMYVLLSGRHPFDTHLHQDDEEVERRIVGKEPDYNAHAMRHVGPVAKDLLRRMMSKDRRQRPSAKEALSHAWFSAVAPLASDVECVAHC
ncbi:kinase-like domain-containing protein [Tribonema minus]|uniref:Kinase-like domain-containing protein n=1 Tax=Tribonema minus TaxID=303371 RepID=A0A835Z8F3_9STRA|nr:kinase-like domain-containing protein [Tribonema minus]